MRLRIAEELSGPFKGEIIGPDHAEYEQARRVWNAMIDRRPGLILRCTSTQDVVAAVNVAREHGLPPAVRCGGHNVAGKAMSDGGLTIDLCGLRDVTVDPERKLVHAGGGCRSATSTRPPRRTASSSRPGSCPRPAWPAWRWAAASAGSPASTASPATTSSPWSSSWPAAR